MGPPFIHMHLRTNFQVGAKVRVDLLPLHGTHPTKTLLWVWQFFRDPKGKSPKRQPLHGTAGGPATLKDVPAFIEITAASSGTYGAGVLLYRDKEGPGPCYKKDGSGKFVFDPKNSKR